MLQYYRKYYPCKYKGAIGRIVGESDNGEWQTFNDIQFNTAPVFKTPLGSAFEVPLMDLEEIDTEMVAVLEKIEFETGKEFEKIYPKDFDFKSIDKLSPGRVGFVELHGRYPEDNEMAEFMNFELHAIMSDFVGKVVDSSFKEELSRDIEIYLRKISGNVFKDQCSVDVFINPEMPKSVKIEPNNLFTLVLINGFDIPPFNLPEEGDWIGHKHKYHYSTYLSEDNGFGSIKGRNLRVEKIK